MRISIALATYNGEKFLWEQLESIAIQTQLPDELIICDDNSTDNTLNILYKFCEQAAFPVKILINTNTLGSTQNFAKAIELCTGDVIFLSDQDDVWNNHKIANLANYLKCYPEVGLVFGDADVVDTSLKPLKTTMWDGMQLNNHIFKSLKSENAILSLLDKNYIAGAISAFRAKYVQAILPIPNGWTHDHWMAIIIAGLSRLLPIHESFNKWRQHTSNVTGIKSHTTYTREVIRSAKRGKLNRAAYIHHQKRLEVLHERLGQYSSYQQNLAWNKFIKGYIQFLQARGTLPESRIKRIPVIMQEIMRGYYQKYAPSGNLSAIKDIIFR